jgi:hypothetical protein
METNKNAARRHKNTGSTFSRFMKTILENQVGHNVFTYVNNIVITNKNKEDYFANLMETFASMCEAKLRLNLEKCVFRVHQGKFFGYLVSHSGIEVNPAKTKSNTRHAAPVVDKRCT